VRTERNRIESYHIGAASCLMAGPDTGFTGFFSAVASYS
jgi:hypothetical protein